MSKNSIALKIREPRRLAQGTLGRRYTTPLWRCDVVLRLAQAWPATRGIQNRSDFRTLRESRTVSHYLQSHSGCDLPELPRGRESRASHSHTASLEGRAALRCDRYQDRTDRSIYPCPGARWQAELSTGPTGSEWSDSAARTAGRSPSPSRSTRIRRSSLLPEIGGRATIPPRTICHISWSGYGLS